MQTNHLRSPWVTTSVVILVSIVWVALRHAYGAQLQIPLSFVVPMLLCVWTRRRWQLWGMAAAFVVAICVPMLLHRTEPEQDRPEHWLPFLATLFNIIIGATVIHLILRLRDRLDDRTNRIQLQNTQLHAQAEELRRQNEEINNQAEELTEQNEEFESQAEELERQNQELSEANERLANREEVLHAAVECSRVAGGARAALEAVCRRTLDIVGPPAGALALLELNSQGLVPRVQAMQDDHPPLPDRWPVEGSLGKVVLQQDQTAYVDDLLKRPDLSAPFDGAGAYRSALATPVRVGGRIAGLLVLCSREPTHWTQEQFRLVEWAAAQVAPLLDSLHWQDELQQRAAAVEAANQAKDQFLAMLSHELRTPLTPVLAAASALESDPRLPPDVRAELAMIQRNVAVQSRLIDDLLDLTRIARGKLDLKQQLLPIATLLREGAAIVAAEVDASEQVLSVDVSLPPECAILGDAARLQQVFWNLLKNAVKFSPRRGRLSVSAAIREGHPRKSDSGGRRVVIRIADEGVGIDRADLERIFQPFEQATAARQRGGNGGLGLGLSIAKAIVDLHDGLLYATSDGPGRGSVFTVELPLADVVPAAPASGGDGAKPAPAAELQPLRVLLVEDHGDTGMVMARLLRRAGHEVVHAQSIHDAWSAWETKRFDMVISDLGLPDGSGLDLMRRIREQDPAVPGVCMSGFGMESDVQDSRAAGFAEHLIKPIDMQQLHAAVRRLAPARSSGSKN
jgi:signal transduction histidine kinase/ActR/RegA family two-component response regulator